MGQKNLAVLTGYRINEAFFSFFYKKMYDRLAGRPKNSTRDNEVTVLAEAGVRRGSTCCISKFKQVSL